MAQTTRWRYDLTECDSETSVGGQNVESHIVVGSGECEMVL